MFVIYSVDVGGNKNNIAIVRAEEKANQLVSGFSENGIITFYEELEVWDNS